MWHPHNNVRIHCKKIFKCKEACHKFFGNGQLVMYASSESEYQSVCDTMNEIYNKTDLKSMDHLYETDIRNFGCRFVKCVTNEVLHLNITVMLRVENAYPILKKQLST